MGYPTKVQLIERQESQQWYINFPAPLAQAMEFEKGEVIEWVIQDKQTLVLHRTGRQQAGRRGGDPKKKTIGLLPHLNELWDECMEAFCQQRTGERARRMAVSQLACVGRHTVTGLLYTAGRQFVDWSGDYRFFSRDRWDSHRLFAPVTAGILEFLPADAPFVGAMDDTIVEKTGTKIPGVGYRRDPLSPAFQVNFIRGQRFLQFAGMLPAGEGPGQARAIPLRFEHVPPGAKPRKSAGEEEWKAYHKARKANNLSTHGARLLGQMREELDRQHGAHHRRFIVGVDGGYTHKTVLKGLPERTTLIGRIRKDAKLFYPPRPEDQPARGAKRQYGQSAPAPEELRKDEGTPWQEVSAFAAGKIHRFRANFPFCEACARRECVERMASVTQGLGNGQEGARWKS